MQLTSCNGLNFISQIGLGLLQVLFVLYTLSSGRSIMGNVMEGQGGKDRRGKELEVKDEFNDQTCGIPCLTFVRGKIAVLDIGLFGFDTGSDLHTAIEHFRNCNFYWGCATLLFIMLPTIPTFVEFMKAKIEEIKRGELCWLGSSRLIKTQVPFSGQSTSFWYSSYTFVEELPWSQLGRWATPSTA